MRRLLLIAAGVSVAVALWSAPPAVPATPTPAGAAAFIKTVVREIVRNDYVHAWLTLHPAQQRLVPQEDYVRCELQSPVSGRLVWVKVARVVTARFAVGGVTGRVSGKAVTVRIKLLDDSTGASAVLTHTAHAVFVAGRWRWILPADRIGLYSSGACG